MKRCGRVFLGILTAAALTAGGCAGSREAEGTTLYVDEDGVLEQAIVEPMGEDTFTQEELRAYIRDDLAAYAEENGGETVALDSCRISEDTVRITLTYASAGDYAAYNQVECFLGTVQEAEGAGYGFEGNFLDAGGNAVEAAAVLEQSGAHVLILEEAITVQVPDDVLYTTSNAAVSGKQTVTVEASEDGFTEEPVYIIYQ